MFETLIQTLIVLGWIVAIAQYASACIKGRDQAGASTGSGKHANRLARLKGAPAEQQPDPLAKARRMYRNDPAMIEALEKQMREGEL